MKYVDNYLGIYTLKLSTSQTTTLYSRNLITIDGNQLFEYDPY